MPEGNSENERVLRRPAQAEVRYVKMADLSKVVDAGMRRGGVG